MKLIKLSLIGLFISLLLSQPVMAYKLSFAFTDEDGNVSGLSIYEDNYLFVDAFATWCESCKDEMIHLERLYDAVGDQIQMLSLSTDREDTIDKINDFKNEFDAQWDFGLDHDEQFLHSYPFLTYPAAYFFDHDGELLRAWTGITTTSKFLNDIAEFIDVPDNDYSDDELEIFVEDILTNPLFLITGSLLFIILIYNTATKMGVISNKQKSIEN